MESDKEMTYTGEIILRNVGINPGVRPRLAARPAGSGVSGRGCDACESSRCVRRSVRGRTRRGAREHGLLTSYTFREICVHLRILRLELTNERERSYIICTAQVQKALIIIFYCHIQMFFFHKYFHER